MDSLLAAAGVAAPDQASQAITTTALASVDPVIVADELVDDDAIIYADPATLLDSPFQPRTVYNEAKLQEGAETMKPPHGRVLQPLVVRDVSEAARPLFAGIDTLITFELVFGHRRKRMALLAGLRRVPIIVRKMTDEQVKVAQIVENLQRDDVHPFDEAEGMEKLRTEHGKTVEQIMDQTGKTRAYVYSRLKLLQACPEIRKACREGEIDAEVALLIARLRTIKLQEKALARIKAKYWKLDDGGKASFRQIRDLLKEEFTLDLKSAIFDITDAALLPGADACTTCPKRSANAPEFEDLLQERKDAWRGRLPGDPNLCTDPDCWAEKKTAHLKAEAAKLAAKGAIVIDGNRARNAIGADGKVKGAYVALADVKSELAKLPKASKAGSALNATPAPQIVTIQNPRDGKTVQAVKVDDLRARGVAVTDAVDGAAKKDAARRERERLAAQRRNDQARAMTSANLELLDRVHAAMAGSARTAEDLRAVVCCALAGVSYWPKRVLEQRWSHPDYADLSLRVAAMDVVELNRLLIECALFENIYVEGYQVDNKNHIPRALHAAAERYGVPIVAQEPTAPTPSTAARAQEEAAAKPEETTAAASPAQSTAARAPRGVLAKANAIKRATARYRNAATGETWSGKGLQPAWLKAAIKGGAKLDDFDTTKAQSQAGSAGSEAKGAGAAGDASSTTPAAAGAKRDEVEA